MPQTRAIDSSLLPEAFLASLKLQGKVPKFPLKKSESPNRTSSSIYETSVNGRNFELSARNFLLKSLGCQHAGQSVGQKNEFFCSSVNCLIGIAGQSKLFSLQQCPNDNAVLLQSDYLFASVEGNHRGL